MITAYEFYERADPDNDNLGNIHHIQDIMVEFAKYHVEKALKAAADKGYSICCDEEGHYVSDVNEDSIIDAYPLNQIK